MSRPVYRIPLRVAVGCLILAAAQAHAATDEWSPGCRSRESGRAVARFAGRIERGDTYRKAFGPGFTFLLEPIENGWRIVIRHGQSDDDIARLTPPWHFAPNPCDIEGW